MLGVEEGFFRVVGSVPFNDNDLRTTILDRKRVVRLEPSIIVFPSGKGQIPRLDT